MLTQAYLQELFTYKDGRLYWRVVRRGAPKNKPLGNDKDIYHSVMIDRKQYLIHRIVFCYFYGYFPENIDHINGNQHDNRIENLRDVTRSGNQQNKRKAYSTSKSGLIGAFYSKKHKNWFSRICIDGDRKWLGTFQTAEDAHNAYISAKRIFHKTCTI